jgi:glycosyltransferase involved in cell wall biosynthesis
VTAVRVLALVPALPDTSPGQRFRMEQWAPHLAARGIDVAFEPFESADLHERLYQPGQSARKAVLIGRAFAARARRLATLSEFDVVYVFREAALLGPALLERWIARRRVPMIFDFDDAVFERYVSPSNGYLSYVKCPGKTATICRLASHVMAGNPYLADYARRFNNRVTVVPTTIDTTRYAPRRPARGGETVVIGWSGSYSTVQHLDVLRAALQRLAGIVPFRLRVIGTSRYELPGVEVVASVWRAEMEVDDLREIDIGIMPLPDDRWSRGKCGLKALQYMALGIPAVCSPVGVNSDIIDHGRNGFLASAEDEWVDRLAELMRSAEARERLGAAGRQTVEERFSPVVQAPRVEEVLRSVTKGSESTT